jgi:hypothetical protein
MNNIFSFVATLATTQKTLTPVMFAPLIPLFGMVGYTFYRGYSAFQAVNRLSNREILDNETAILANARDIRSNAEAIKLLIQDTTWDMMAIIENSRKNIRLNLAAIDLNDEAVRLNSEVAVRKKAAQTLSREAVVLSLNTIIRSAKAIGMDHALAIKVENLMDAMEKGRSTPDDCSRNVNRIVDEFLNGVGQIGPGLIIGAGDAKAIRQNAGGVTDNATKILWDAEYQERPVLKGAAALHCAFAVVGFVTLPTIVGPVFCTALSYFTPYDELGAFRLTESWVGKFIEIACKRAASAVRLSEGI